jgi:7-cyano-7-deazaguanine synthase in queuosine biosynthesis
MEYSWSCYKAGEKHCGVCSSCIGKKWAYSDLGIPITEDEWENTKVEKW